MEGQGKWKGRTDALQVKGRAEQLTGQLGRLGAEDVAWQQPGRHTAASNGPAQLAALPAPLPPAGPHMQGLVLNALQCSGCPHRIVTLSPCGDTCVKHMCLCIVHAG